MFQLYKERTESDKRIIMLDANISVLDKIFSIAIVFLPFLYQYKGVGNTISLGELLLSIIIFLIIILKEEKKLIIQNKTLLLFNMVSIILTILCYPFSYFSISEALTVVARLLFYSVVIYIGRKHFNLVYIKKIYYIIVFVFSVYLIIQYLTFMVSGLYLPIYLKHEWQFPPEARDVTGIMLNKFNFRASSLFLEPSYFSLFTLPSICLLLYDRQKRLFDKIIMLTATIAIMLSTASSGIVGIFIIVCIYLFGRNKNIKRRIVIVGLSVGLVIVYITVLNTVSAWTINRLVRGSSINERIVRGLIVFDELPFIHKLIGVGLNNLGPYMIEKEIFTIYDESNLNYSSSIVQTLNYSGIIGFSFLIVFYFKMLLKSRVEISLNGMNKQRIFDSGITQALFLILIYMSMFESIFFSYRFAYLFIIVEGARKIEKEYENNIY